MEGAGAAGRWAGHVHREPVRLGPEMVDGGHRFPQRRATMASEHGFPNEEVKITCFYVTHQAEDSAFFTRSTQI